MTTVHIGVTSRDDFKNRAKAAFKGERQGSHIGFASLERMHKVLTPNRWTDAAGDDGPGANRASVNWRERWSAMSNKCILTSPP